MAWYHYFALSALLLCLASLSYHLVRLIRSGPPRDYSRKKGDPKRAIMYSFLGAMDPRKKESAFLHLPTYAAGLVYHMGTFASVVVAVLIVSGVHPDGLVRWTLAGILAASAASGLGILVKRMGLKKMRSLSSPDDYISNLLVTLFQFFTLLTLVTASGGPAYFLSASVLLLYLPLGKLKHALYFFAARYHLGLFYGWRGIWPEKGGK